MHRRRTATKKEIRKAREMLLKSNAKPTRPNVRSILSSFGLKYPPKRSKRRYRRSK